MRRWVSTGGIRVHPAAIGAPVLLPAIAVLWRRERYATALLLVAAALGLHVAQPDAGQATAFAAGVLLLAARVSAQPTPRLILALITVGGASAAWLRPDRLQPAAFTETIVSLAGCLRFGVVAQTLAVASLLALPVSALRVARRPPSHRASCASTGAGALLAAYLAATIAVSVGGIGTFPTPVLGFGASPILGAILGLGTLGALAAMEAQVAAVAARERPF